jgi:hypothetical protein
MLTELLNGLGLTSGDDVGPTSATESEAEVGEGGGSVVGGARDGKVTVLTVSKKISDQDMIEKYANTYVRPETITKIIRRDTDVYTDDGRLLLRFRRNALPGNHIDAFYDNVISFARNTTSNRGSTTGSQSKNVLDNPKVMSNIFGYFDRFPPGYKVSFRRAGVRAPLEVRKCRFNADYPEKYAQTVPLIRDIDTLYRKYTPDHYACQARKARQTHFKIPGTSFTTVTTNVNFRTTIHKDKGDDREGFGNLVVIERGRYSGAETCFPQYGIGVDVRTGDMLFMDVHEWHGNLPMKSVSGPREGEGDGDDEAVRLSIVCYLRYNIWLRTKNRTRRFYERHNHTLRKLTRGGPANGAKTRSKK